MACSYRVSALDIVSHLLESEDLDPTVEIDRLVEPQEVCSNQYVRVLVPSTFQSLRELTGLSHLAFTRPGKNVPFSVGSPETFHRFTKEFGKLYVAFDVGYPSTDEKSPRAVIMNFETGKAFDGHGGPILWKDISKHLSEPAADSLQQGLGDYFVKEGKRKGQARLAVKALTRLGRYDDAARFGRHAARMTGVPMGQALAVARSRQRLKLRTNNRFTRLISAQGTGEVKWGENGLWLLFNDWDSLLPFFHKNCRKTAERVFNNDNAYDYHSGGGSVKDDLSNASSRNEETMMQLLVGRSVESEDFASPITEEDADSMTSRELADILTNEQNEDALDDILHALRSATHSSMEQAYEAVYWKKFNGALCDAFGNEEHKWINVELPNGVKEKLGFFVTYETLETWLGYWLEEHGEEYTEDIHSLAREYIDPIEVDTQNISPDFDSDNFNELLAEALAEIDAQPYPDLSDENQPEFPWQDERKERSLVHKGTVRVFPPGGRAGAPETYREVRHPEAHKYKGVMGNERVQFTSEAIEAVRALLEYDEVNDLLNRVMDNQFALVHLGDGRVLFWAGRPVGMPDTANDYSAWTEDGRKAKVYKDREEVEALRQMWMDGDSRLGPDEKEKQYQVAHGSPDRWDFYT